LSPTARPRFVLPAILLAASAAYFWRLQPSRAQPAQPPADQTAARAVTPPQVIDHVDAIYPPAELARGTDTNVIVTVTVERDGTVSDAQVSTSGGAAFDASAIAAVRLWRFAPATKDGKPVRARIRVPFHFSPGPHSPSETGHEHTPEPAAPAPAKTTTTNTNTNTNTKNPEKQTAHEPTSKDPHHEPHVTEGVAFPHAVAEPGKPIEIHVQGLPSPPRRGGADFRFDHRVLTAVGHPTAADLLRVAPSAHVMHPEGEAVAQRIILRGFDADHGQDVEFTAGVIPINQASHIHGQGYADLNIILPETVRALRVVEGVYDPRQGDFAVAGTVEYELGVPERGTRLSVGYGSFNTKRALAMWAPETAAEETFAAASFKTSDGFGDGTRGSISGGFSGQYRFELQSDFSALLHASAYGARAGLAGVVRTDDIEAGNVGFYDAYRDPTARSQSAAASRAQGSLTIQRVSDDGSYVTGSVWMARSDFRSRLNFTGFTQRSRVNPAWAGRGDLIEQSNGDTGFGAKFAYRTRKTDHTPWIATQLTLGADGRTEHVEQTQNLLEAPQNETWDRRVDATVRATSVGLWGDLLIATTKFARLRGGLRADLLLYDIDDRLGNFIPAAQQETHIEGFRRTAAGIAWGPRAMLEVDPLAWLKLHAGYGEGYRSPQARQLEEGESAPFAKVRSYEVGARVAAPGSVAVTGSIYETRLSSDLVFEASEGRLERIGPTTRRGFSVYMTASPVTGFFSSVSATYVRATLDSPPPATPDNPSPPYAEGQALPFVPPIVIRADVSYERDLFKVRGEPLKLHAGYAATFLSPRPLPYDQESQAVFLLDASLSVRRTFLEVGVDAANLLNAQYADTELFFVSHWPTHAVPSYLPARHISAGPPLSILGHVTLHL
jgi:TonB family protein